MPPLAPSIPTGLLHFVLCDFGKLGASWVERDQNDMDRATTVRHVMEMQFDRPLMIIAVDPAEGWSRDVTEGICREIAATREPLHPSLIEFIESHCGTLLANELVEDVV